MFQICLFTYRKKKKKKVCNLLMNYMVMLLMSANCSTLGVGTSNTKHKVKRIVFLAFHEGNEHLHVCLNSRFHGTTL